MSLRFAFEDDTNPRFLLLAWRQRKVRVSAGSPASLASSSDSYIVIKSLPALYLRVLLVAFLPFGMDTVIVGEWSFSFSCLRSGIG